MSKTEERRRDLRTATDRRIGEIIYRTRTRLGLTLDQVGTAIERDHSTIKQYETGTRSVPKHNVNPLAEVLGLDPILLDREAA